MREGLDKCSVGLITAADGETGAILDCPLHQKPLTETPLSQGSRSMFCGLRNRRGHILGDTRCERMRIELIYGKLY